MSYADATAFAASLATTLMVVIAPIALFLAIVYTLHKLNSDSELVAMSAAGASPWQILRAPLALSIVCWTASSQPMSRSFGRPSFRSANCGQPRPSNR